MAEYFRISSNEAVNLLELMLPESIDGLEFDRISASMLGALEGKAGSRWVLDLSHVDYMGSAILGLMVNIRQQIKSASGALVLCNMSPRLTQIFHTCSLERLFIISRSQSDAISRVVSI